MKTALKDVNYIKETVKELIKLLGIRQDEILEGDNYLTLYQKGKMDGLNIAIEEMTKVLKL